jgi:hypothetical protein
MLLISALVNDIRNERLTKFLNVLIISHAEDKQGKGLPYWSQSAVILPYRRPAMTQPRARPVSSEDEKT